MEEANRIMENSEMVNGLVRKDFVNHKNEHFSCLSRKSSDEKAIVHFAHANGMNAQTYSQLFSLLGNQISLYSMDFRGHGQSQAEANPNNLKDWDQHREDLIAFLEQFKQPVFLVGHSMGAGVSIRVASKRPDLVKGLILVEPFLPNHRTSHLLYWLKLTRLIHYFPLAQAAKRRRAIFPSKPIALISYMGRGAFTTWDKSWINDYLEGGTKVREDGQIELTCSPAWESKNFKTLSHKLWRSVQKINSPITLLYGEKGSSFQRNGLPELKKLHPSIRLVHNEQASHFLPMEFPDQVARAIEEQISQDSFK